MGGRGCGGPIRPNVKISNALHQDRTADTDYGNQDGDQGHNQGYGHQRVESAQEGGAVYAQYGKQQNAEDTGNHGGDAQQDIHQLGEKGNGSSNGYQAHHHGVNVKEHGDNAF